jgi:hypothetical protein
MSNIGQLLHKLTKYQSLYDFVADKSKRSMYSQKIAYYKQQLQQAGIDQNNINGVQNLVGGNVYTEEANTLITRLFPTEPTELSEDHKQKIESVTTKITEASTKIDTISSTYSDIFETITYIIDQIKDKMKTSGHVPISQISGDILEKLTNLEGKINKLSTTIKPEEFKSKLVESYAEVAASSSASRRPAASRSAVGVQQRQQTSTSTSTPTSTLTRSTSRANRGS